MTINAPDHRLAVSGDGLDYLVELMTQLYPTRRGGTVGALVSRALQEMSTQIHSVDDRAIGAVGAASLLNREEAELLRQTYGSYRKAAAATGIDYRTIFRASQLPPDPEEGNEKWKQLSNVRTLAELLTLGGKEDAFDKPTMERSRTAGCY